MTSFLFSCRSPRFHFVYFLFLSFPSIWLLSLCFPWLSPLLQYCLDSGSRLQLRSAVCVCVLYHAHYNYLWVWVCHLFPARVPISLRVVRELHPDGSACAHNNVAEKWEVSSRMNGGCVSKKNKDLCHEEEEHLNTSHFWFVFLLLGQKVRRSLHTKRL